MRGKPDEPLRLSINAHAGDGRPLEGVARLKWAARAEPTEVKSFLKPPPLADPNDWRDPRVGWGLIVPDRDDYTSAQLADLADVPEPIRELVKARNPAPVFRYRRDSPSRYRLIRNTRDRRDASLGGGSEPGVAPGALPRYLLIYGTPEEIPWSLQFQLNAGNAVGRLSLRGEALENYVQCLLNDWRDAGARGDHAVVWSADRGPRDITRLMRHCLAAPIARRLAEDSQFGPRARFLDGAADPAQGAAEQLIQALKEQKPGLIVTTSHGQTGPLDDPETMAARLGCLVDQNERVMSPDELLDGGWEPGGAIWYAHACCSAGSDKQTRFDGLVDPDTEVARVLGAVAALGARVAPTPEALLGAPKPLRAFVGHVEPTFDWTLKEPKTNQYLTSPLVRGLYDNLYQPMTIGWALRDFFARVGPLYVARENSHRDFEKGSNTMASMLYATLSAYDVESTVILGDPTVVPPALPEPPQSSRPEG